MSNDYRIISSKEVINEITNIICSDDDKLHNTWKNVVSKIKRFNDTENITFGEKIAMNSHVVDLKNGILLIETNHSGWIQYIRIYEKFILKGLNTVVPELKIKSLAFRIKGSLATLSESYEESVKQEMNKRKEVLDRNEEKLNSINYYEKEESKNTLPKELFDKLESIKTVLTNTKK